MNFSVLTPSFNQGQFITKAIRSIAIQLSISPVQILVADAESFDNTLDELKSLQSKNILLQVVSEPDSGPANALNKAFAQSNGDIIGWLNADDEYLPTAFESVHDFFLANPDMLMVYGHGQQIDVHGAVLGLYPTLKPSVPIDRFQRGCFISQPTVFMRRELVESIGPFNEGFRSAFDLEYWLRVFLRYPDRIGFIDGVLASTRIHENTITSKQRARGAYEAMLGLKTHLGYVESNWARSYLNEIRHSTPDIKAYSVQANAFLEQIKPLLETTDRLNLQQEFLDPPTSNQTPSPHSTEVPVSSSNITLPWLARLVYAARVDLRQKMDLNTAQGYWSFCAWLVRSSINANRSLCHDAEFISFCEKTLWPGTELNLVEAVIYQASPVFAEKYPLPIKTAQFKFWLNENREQPVLALYKPLLNALVTGVAELESMQQIWPQNSTLAGHKPAGYNVIGYVQTQSGIGEDARTTFNWLRQQGHACSLIDFKPGDPIAQNVHSHDMHLVKQGPYSTNLICLPATEMVRYAVTEGLMQMKGRHNIGYWPWELNDWPNAWKPIEELVDEVWVASVFIRNAIFRAVRKPIKVVPLQIELGPIAPLTRKDFGLPEYAKLFCFSFDLNSSIHRKNPHDCLKMFLQSFPIEEGWGPEQVGLVIKTYKPSQASEEWNTLKTLVDSDPRIHIFEQSFFRPDLLALYNNCDCFLSLHRAEGYGRNIAEAILLGLEIVTTGYSGNLDFCFPPQCTLVDFELIPVGPGQYPDGDGMKWAGNFKLPKLDATRRRFINKAGKSILPEG